MEKDFKEEWIYRHACWYEDEKNMSWDNAYIKAAQQFDEHYSK